MTLPFKNVKIGAQFYAVLEKNPKDDSMLGEGNYGYTTDETNEVVVDEGLHISKKKVTVFHELMHAARMCHESPTKPGRNAGYGDWEHYFIGIWESSILLMLRDNPALTKWLLEEKTSERQQNNG